MKLNKFMFIIPNISLIRIKVFPEYKIDDAKSRLPTPMEPTRGCENHLLVWLLTQVIVNTNNVLRATVLVIFANLWHVKQVLNKETKQDQNTINFDSSNSSSSEEFEISSSDYNISSSRTKLSLCLCSISE